MMFIKQLAKLGIPVFLAIILFFPGARAQNSPLASFIASPQATNPLAINFTDQSTGDIAKWKWDFGDGSVPFIVSYQQKPEGVLVNTSIPLSTTIPNVSGNIIVGRSNMISLARLLYYDMSSNTLIDTGEIADKLGGLPARKFHCSILADQVFKKAVENYRKNLKS